MNLSSIVEAVFKRHSKIPMISNLFKDEPSQLQLNLKTAKDLVCILDQDQVIVSIKILIDGTRKWQNCCTTFLPEYMIETKESERESCSWFNRRSTQKSLPDQLDLIWCAFTKFNVQLLPCWMHFKINNQMSRLHYSKLTRALTIQIKSIHFPNSL